MKEYGTNLFCREETHECQGSEDKMLADREIYMKIDSSEEIRSSTNHAINDIKVAQ